MEQKRLKIGFKIAQKYRKLLENYQNFHEKSIFERKIQVLEWKSCKNWFKIFFKILLTKQENERKLQNLSKTYINRWKSSEFFVEIQFFEVEVSWKWRESFRKLFTIQYDFCRWTKNTWNQNQFLSEIDKNGRKNHEKNFAASRKVRFKGNFATLKWFICGFRNREKNLSDFSLMKIAEFCC